MLVGSIADTHHLEQRRAGRGLLDVAVLEQQVIVHIEDAGRVLGPLAVATQPVERLGDPAQHGTSSGPSACCCCWACWLSLLSTGPGSGGSVQTVMWLWRWRAARRSRASPEGASTHVSLEPPPWLEFTTRLPSGSATRVRPPGRNPHAVAVVHGEGPQVDVARPERLAGVRRRGRQRDHTPARSSRVGWRAPRLASRRSVRRWRAGRSSSRSRPEPSTGFTTSSSSRSSTWARCSGSSRWNVSTVSRIGFSSR